MRLKQKYNFKKIFLEKLSSRHLSDINEYSLNPKFYKHLEFNVFKNKSETLKYFKKKIKKNDFKKEFWWAIRHIKDNKIIGTFVIHNLNLIRMNCEISYGISPKYQNRGFFKLIVKNFVKLLRNKKIVRIQAVTAQKNIASIIGLKKCGFKIEGILNKYYFSQKRKKYYNGVILSKV